MTRPIRFGLLTPSSNTVVEPVSFQLFTDLPEVSVHFARFRVTQITLDDAGLKQFDITPILDAALLLADAKVDVITWNGTSASWLGFETDLDLCLAITERTGIPATSSILVMNEALRRWDVKRYALLTPYTSDVEERIIANYNAAGLTCVAQRRFDLTDNFAFSEVPQDAIRDSLDALAESEPDAIAVVCTNMRVAPLVPGFEARRNIPVFDSVLTACLGCLEVIGIQTGRLAHHGRLFADAAKRHGK